MVGVLMMDGMRPLPGIVGHQHDGVDDISYGILELLVFGEGTVAAFMRQDPEAHGDGASNGRVGSPDGERQERIGVEHIEHIDTDGRAKGRTNNGNGKVTK